MPAARCTLASNLSQRNMVRMQEKRLAHMSKGTHDSYAPALGASNAAAAAARLPSQHPQCSQVAAARARRCCRRCCLRCHVCRLYAGLRWPALVLPAAAAPAAALPCSLRSASAPCDTHSGAASAYVPFDVTSSHLHPQPHNAAGTNREEARTSWPSPSLAWPSSALLFLALLSWAVLSAPPCALRRG